MEDKAMLVKLNSTLPYFVNNIFGEDKSLEYYNKLNSKPAVNVLENENEFQIEVAAPGFSKKDFSVKLENLELTISGKKEGAEEEGTHNYARKEFAYGNFERSFQIPERSIDQDNVKANYKNGVLYITLPKLEEAKIKPARAIDIS